MEVRVTMGGEVGGRSGGCRGSRGGMIREREGK